LPVTLFVCDRAAPQRAATNDVLAVQGPPWILDRLAFGALRTSARRVVTSPPNER
jgi:hypothetical protein